MNSKSKLVVFVILLHIFSPMVGAKMRVVQYLKKHYNPKVKPTKNVSDPVTVYTGMKTVSIISVDEQNEEIRLITVFDAHWTDELIGWAGNPDVEDEETVTLYPGNVWVPDIFFRTTDDYFKEGNYNFFPLKINRNGRVSWFLEGYLKIYCPLDLTLFPFDMHKCTLLGALWASDNNTVYLQHNGDKLVIVDGKVLPAGGLSWSICNFSLSTNPADGRVSREISSVLIYTYIIVRDPKYYVLNLVVPIILLSFLGPFVFMVSPDSGEKLSLGITVLLSFTVFVTVLLSRLPESSKSMPYVFYYIGTLITLNVLSMFLAITLSKLFHAAQDTTPPSWMNQFAPIEKTHLDVKKPGAKNTENESASNGTLNDQDGVNGNEIKFCTTEEIWWHFVKFLDRTLCGIFLFLNALSLVVYLLVVFHGRAIIKENLGC